MVTTQFNGGLRARPLEARADRDAGVIWFLTDVRGAKDDEIDAAMILGWSSSMGVITLISRSLAALSCHATSQTKTVWKKTDDPWFPGGPDDPNVRLLRQEPITAELWDGPSSASGTVYEFANTR